MTHHTPLAYPPCRVPLRTARGAFGINLTVHEGIYADVWEAHRRWKALGGPDFWLIRQADTGSYSCRNSVGHSRAVSIDFNWSSNGMTSKRTPCPGDMPETFYRECWEPLGYGWGALWRSKCDRMHISKLLSEGGDGVLYRTWGGEEDDLPMNQVEFDKLMTTWATKAKIVDAKPDEPSTLAGHLRENFVALFEREYEKDEAGNPIKPGKVVQHLKLVSDALDNVLARLERLDNKLDQHVSGGG